MSPETVAANRANAALSTGPKTPEGKERVKYNALRHGCYSATVVLPYEDHAAYAALGVSLREEFRPASPAREALVQKIQDATWRLNRVLAIDANLHVVGTQQHLATIDEQFDSSLTISERYALAQAAAFQTNARTFDQLGRQEGRLNRLLSELHKQLAATPTPQTRPAVYSSATPAVVENIPDGFVRAAVPPMPTFVGPLADIKRKQWLRQHGLATK